MIGLVVVWTALVLCGCSKRWCKTKQVMQRKHRQLHSIFLATRSVHRNACDSSVPGIVGFFDSSGVSFTHRETCASPTCDTSNRWSWSSMITKRNPASQFCFFFTVENWHGQLSQNIKNACIVRATFESKKFVTKQWSHRLLGHKSCAQFHDN